MGASAGPPKTTADYLKDGKVIILFKSTGNAPALKQTKFKLGIENSASVVISFLRKQLKLAAADPLFIFVNSTFQPSPDDVVSELFKCFHQNGKLVINYATTQAWG